MSFADELKERVKKSSQSGNDADSRYIDDKEIARVTEGVKNCILKRASALADLGENSLEGFVCQKWSGNVCKHDLMNFAENETSRMLTTGEHCLIETFGTNSSFVVKLCNSLADMITSLGFEEFSIKPVLKTFYVSDKFYGAYSYPPPKENSRFFQKKNFFRNKAGLYGSHKNLMVKKSAERFDRTAAFFICDKAPAFDISARR